MDKRKNQRKSRQSVSTFSIAEDRRSVREVKPKPVDEDSRTTKRSASVEAASLDNETRLAKEAMPVAEAVPDEGSPRAKEKPDELPALSKPVDTQPPAAASPTDHQERLSNEDNIPMAAPLQTTEVKPDAENPETEIDKVTGVQLLAAWQPQKGALPGVDLTRIFGNGFLQFTALLIATIAEFALICHNLLHSVVAPSVKHWCKQPPEYFNMTSEGWRDISAPQDANGVWNQCLRYEPPLSMASSNRTKLPCKEWDYEDGSGNSILTEWNLVCERRWLLTLAYEGYVIGAMVATPIAGMLSDEVGRRPVICVSAMILVVSGMAVCFTTTFAAFMVVRIFVAASVSSIQTTSLVLLFELLPPRHQWRYCVFAVGAGLISAPPFLGLLDIFKTNWILAQALIMLPTSMLTWALHVTAESPCWLMSKAKYEDVEHAMLWAARMNGGNVNETKRQWRSTLEVLRQVEAEGCTQGKSGLSDILSSCTLLHRTAILFFVWFTAIIAYYARFRTRRTVSLWLLGASVALKISSFSFMYQFLKRQGRRLTLCAVFAGFSLMFGCATLLTELDHFRAMVEIIHWLCDVLMDMTIALLCTYSDELFPTEVRNIGLCAVFFLRRIGGALAPVIFKVAQTEAFFAVSATGVLAALMVLLLPETMSCPIVDTIKDMEEGNLKKSWLALRSSSPFQLSPLSARSRKNTCQNTHKSAKLRARCATKRGKARCVDSENPWNTSSSQYRDIEHDITRIL